MTIKSTKISERNELPFQFRAGLLFVAMIEILLIGCSQNSDQAPLEPKNIPSASKAIDAKHNLEPSKEAGKNTQKDENDNKPASSPREIMKSEMALNKNQTIVLMYAHPDVRSEYMIMHLNDFLSPEQRDQAIAISMKFEEDVAKIRQERSEILENATDDQDVDQLLLENRRKSVELFNSIRKKIFVDVLTKEQKQKVAERNAKLKNAK